MRILTFTSLFPNATAPNAAIFVYQRISHLARRAGNHVEVVAPVPYAPKFLKGTSRGCVALVPKLESIGSLQVHHPRYPLIPAVSMPFHGLLMYAGCLRKARILHMQHCFDCIDAHYAYPDGFAATLLGMALKLPVFISARGTDVNLFPHFRTIRPLIVWSLRKTAGIIAVSAALKTSIIGLGIPEESICVIPNGVDSKRFFPRDRAVTRQRLKVPSDQNIAVSVGSLTESKNHRLLVSAFAEVLRDYPKSRLYIIGEGTLRQALEALIRAEQLEKNIVLAGPRPNEEIALWLSAADVSCLTSCREGWPNVLMESIACGTPVVATRVGGIPEILCSPELGILVDENKESVAAGLKRAFATVWDRRAMKQYAEERGWDNVATEAASFLETRLGTAKR